MKDIDTAIAIYFASHVLIVLALIITNLYADMWCGCCGRTTKCNSSYSYIPFK